jgi:glycosyltransferase involved in cell wall biosynthesis
VKSSLVSIIMPVYNGEKYLYEAVQSVLNQSWEDWELVVVDDGSTDRTAEIIKYFRDKRIKYFHQDNRGQASALNQGLSLSSGDYITTLDADDWLPQDSIRARAELLGQNPDINVVYGDGNYLADNGSVIKQFSKQMPNGAERDVYKILIVSPFYGTGASVLVRRKVLDEFDIRYDEEMVWCQDWDFYIRLAEVTDFAYVDTITINYRIHQEGMTVVMPGDRRLNSLIRLRQRVINSQRFIQLDESAKYGFYYDFLIKNLDGKIKNQAAVINSLPFRGLSASTQSRLLRSCAFTYMIRSEELGWVRKCLYIAWIKKPTDPKTSLATFLALFSPKLASKIVHFWQNRHTQEVRPSPFEQLITAKH